MIQQYRYFDSQLNSLDIIEIQKLGINENEELCRERWYESLQQLCCHVGNPSSDVIWGCLVNQIQISNTWMRVAVCCKWNFNVRNSSHKVQQFASSCSSCYQGSCWCRTGEDARSIVTGPCLTAKLLFSARKDACQTIHSITKKESAVIVNISAVSSDVA